MKTAWLTPPAVALGVLLSCQTAPVSRTSESVASEATSPTARTESSAQSGPSPAVLEEESREIAEIMKMIAGREEEPAEKVFKNIQVLKGVPAGRIPRIMQMGYSRSLGVSCEHCHVEEGWELDEKRPKSAAREMALMTRQLNETLKGMTHIGEGATVNCTTCHRGQLQPATSMTRR